MSRRSFALTAATKRMTKDLDETYDDLVAVALRLAKALDDPKTPASSLGTLTREYRSTMAAMVERSAPTAREQAWGSTAIRAV